MNEENQVTEQKMIPYYVHEGEMARQERHIKRLWILCLVIFAALVVTNAGWIVYENSFEDVVVTQEGTTDGGGNVTLSGVGSGTINNYGEGETDNTSAETEDGR